MKKKFSLNLIMAFALVFLFVTPKGFCEDSFWDAPMQIDTAAKSQQKAVTDQEFEKVMSLLEKKKNKKKEKEKPKGSALNTQFYAPDEENANPSGELSIINNMYEAYPTVMIPVTLSTPYGTEIPIGYYRILSVKKGHEYFLNFYQGNSLIAKIPAHNTGNDHNQKSLNYTKVLTNSPDYVTVIYGDIDCNLETKLYIKK